MEALGFTSSSWVQSPHHHLHPIVYHPDLQLLLLAPVTLSPQKTPPSHSCTSFKT